MSNIQRWDVMSIREYVDRSGQNKTYWTKVGVGFTNQNGSINIELEAIPLSGRLQLQIPLSKEERQQRRGNNQQGGNQQRGGYQQNQQRPQQGGNNQQRYQRGNQQLRPPAQPMPADNLFNQPQQNEPPPYDQGGDDDIPF